MLQQVQRLNRNATNRGRTQPSTSMRQRRNAIHIPLTSNASSSSAARVQTRSQNQVSPRRVRVRVPPPPTSSSSSSSHSNEESNSHMGPSFENRLDRLRRMQTRIANAERSAGRIRRYQRQPNLQEAINANSDSIATRTRLRRNVRLRSPSNRNEAQNRLRSNPTNNAEVINLDESFESPVRRRRRLVSSSSSD